MSTNRDPLDRLRDADPLAGQPLPDASDPDAAAMRDAIIRSAGGAVPIDGRRRRRRLVAGGVALTAAIATAAALAVRTTPVEDPLSVGCYAGASTGASTIVLGSTSANPVDECRALWESGEFIADLAADQVPDLVACVLDTAAVVGVFPAGSCDDVDTTGADVAPWSPSTTTPRPDRTAESPEGVSPSATGDDDPTTQDDPPDDGLSMPDFQTRDQDVREALNEIRLAMLDRCLSLEAATVLAEGVLADHGIEGWTVEPVIEWPSPDMCAGYFPDAPEQAVYFVPDDPQPGQTLED